MRTRLATTPHLVPVADQAAAAPAPDDQGFHAALALILVIALFMMRVTSADLSGADPAPAAPSARR
jgi:hypothetical protein